MVSWDRGSPRPHQSEQTQRRRKPLRFGCVPTDQRSFGEQPRDRAPVSDAAEGCRGPTQAALLLVPLRRFPGTAAAPGRISPNKPNEDASRSGSAASPQTNVVSVSSRGIARWFRMRPRAAAVPRKPLCSWSRSDGFLGPRPPPAASVRTSPTKTQAALLLVPFRWFPGTAAAPGRTEGLRSESSVSKNPVAPCARSPRSSCSFSW